MGSEISFLLSSSTTHPFSQPFCLCFPLTSAKEGERAQEGWASYGISDLDEVHGTHEGDFSSVVAAQSSEQQGCQRVQLGKGVCAKLALSLGLERSVMVQTFGGTAQISPVLSSLMRWEW